MLYQGNILNASVYYLRRTSMFYRYVFMHVYILLTTVLVNRIFQYICVNKTAENMILIYIVIENIRSVLTKPIIDNTCTETSIEITSIITAESYKLFDSMSFKDKQKTKSSIFEQKMNEYICSIIGIVDWGFPQITQLISAIITCVQVIIMLGPSMVVLFIGIIIICSYKFWISKDITKNDIQRSKFKKEKMKLKRYISMATEKMMNGKTDIDGILKRSNDINAGMRVSDNLWINMMTSFEYTNQLVLILVYLWFRTDSNLVSILQSVKDLKSALKNFLYFANSYRRMEVDYISYVEYWQNQHFEPFPEQVSLPDVLNIKYTSIATDDKKFHVHSESLSIVQGARILIDGESGSGKSMFLNGLLGKIEGVVLDGEYTCANYYGSISEFYQSITTSMNTSVMSIRDLFNESPNTERIRYCLKLCQVGEWSNMDLDTAIGGKPSGGQTARLALATRIFDMLERRTQMLVLDEPEQNTDPPLAYVIIKDILELCKKSNITVILISHLEQRRKHFRFDMELNVSNGIVSARH